MIWIWLAGFGLFAIMAGAGVWAVTRTSYLPKLAMWLVRQALPPILKRMPPDEEAEWRKLQLRGATNEDIEKWQRARRLKRRQKRNLPK